MSFGHEELTEQLAGRYAVERELGRGGMATVYLARDLRHPRNVAIKVLRPELASSLAADRFRAEIGIAAALSHPHILPVFDSGGTDDRLFFVMPYVEGDTLRQRLKREGRLPVDEAVQLAREIADALAYAHSRGIVHRDIKPENVLLVAGHAVVTDFGIARAIAQATDVRLTGFGMAIGTPQYMSPEQATGDRNVDGRSDVYSLGCVLYEMLTGAPPHEGTTPHEVIAEKLTAAPKSVRALRPEVPAAVDDVLARAIAVDPAKRYTAEELADALSRPSRAVRARGFAVTRGRWLVSGAVAGILAVAAIGAYFARPRSVIGNDGRIGVAVMPFRATAPWAAQLSEAIPDLLATALDGTPGLRVADPWAVWRSLRAKPNDAARSPDPAEGEALARRVGVCCYVLGSIAQLPPSVELSIRIYRLGSSDPWSTFAVSGSPDSLSRLVQRVAVELIRRLADERPGLAPSSIEHLTDSPDALKEWLRAREQQRRGQVDSADAAIARAIALDSNFVLALIDAGSIRSWASFVRGDLYDGSRALAERAVRLSDSLPERSRARARAMLASMDTRGRDASDALERILTLDSLDLQAWSLLAYVQNAYGWQFGATEKDAINATERALRLDSTNAPNVVTRAYYALALDDIGDLEREMTRVRRLDTTVGIARSTLHAIDAVRSSDAAFAKMAGQLASASQQEWIAVYRVLRIFRTDRAELLAQRTLALPGATASRAASGGLIQLYAAEGRWRLIDSLRRARVLDQVKGFDRQVDRLTVAAAIGGAADETLGRDATASLMRGRSPDSALAQFERQPVWLEGWLIGAYSAMYGDTSLARQWQAALRSLPKGGTPENYNSALDADIASRLFARRGNRVQALEHARRAYALWTIHTENQFEMMPEPAIRYNLAVLLRADRQTRDAAELFRSLVPPTTWMGFYTPRAALELAELEENAGDRSNARRNFLIAFKTWERGDSSIAPYRERARHGLARVGS
ncbi:MAG: serine/threonine-protein kinase [Gemmatimonadaceae bacterium]